jgi:LysR family nitrogen assimilation transcriptional regulator
MNFRQLDYFVHVTELGSFTKAAALLSVAQSALSHQVRQLEVELKQTLLYRNGRGVMPTDAGKRLLAHARGILQQVNRAHDELCESRGAPVGHVCVGLPASLAERLTVPLVRRFRLRFPHASFAMMEGMSAVIIEWLVSGRIDLGLAFNPSPSPAIEITPLLEHSMYLIGPKVEGKSVRAMPVPLRELARYPLIIPSRPNANRMRVETQLSYLGIKPTISMEIDGIASVLGLVVEGCGYAVLPLSSVQGDPRANLLTARPIINPRLTIQMSLVISAQRPTTPLTREALGMLHELVLEVLGGRETLRPRPSSSPERAAAAVR